MDTLSPIERSQRMALIHAADTKPEMVVRAAVHRAGFRYRLHVSKLPGKPDLVFPRLRRVLFVHGCFWHRHPRCALARLPKSRLDFWVPKLTENRQRDLRNIARLRRAGWQVAVIWECEVAKPSKLDQKIRKFLGHKANAER